MFENNENEAVEFEDETSEFETEGEEVPVEMLTVTDTRKAVRAAKAVYVAVRFNEEQSGFIQAKKGSVLDFLRDFDKKDEIEAEIDRGGNVWIG